MDASALQFNQADPVAWRDRLVHGSASESERVGAVSREFESILLRQYLGEALKPLTKGGDLFGGNNAIYGYMITDALANSLSASGTFGFSNLMQAQLSGPATLDHDDHTDTP